MGEGDCLRRARPDKSGLGLGGEAEISREKMKELY